jgi:RNA polymerase sigma-70 factor (ECF subfamily)
VIRLLWTVLVASAADALADDAEIDWRGQLEAIGRGDRTALARIRRLVTRQLVRLGAYGHRDSWDDFAQEIVIRAWRAHRDGRIRDYEGFPGFVRTSTRNAFVDWVRSHRREADVPDDAVLALHDEQGAERPPDPGLQLVLRRALDALPERHREVVTCLYLEGLSYDETAEKLGRPRGTINRLQREAILALRERLRPGEEGAR